MEVRLLSIDLDREGDGRGCGGGGGVRGVVSNSSAKLEDQQTTQAQAANSLNNVFKFRPKVMIYRHNSYSFIG